MEMCWYTRPDIHEFADTFHAARLVEVSCRDRFPVKRTRDKLEDQPLKIRVRT